MYDNATTAAGYAFDRPPVHERIIAGLGMSGIERALDVGCGAGRSAATLAALATSVVGLEVRPQMLAHRLPGPRYVVGAAERLPFGDGSFDLITAVGALNYVDNSLFLPEAARTMWPEGRLVIYDFGTGRRGNARLEAWHADFARRCPPDPGYALDPRELSWRAAGLRLLSYEEREVRISMTLERYTRYILTEGGAGAARWCQETLPKVFAGSSLDVIFDTYVACAGHDS